MTVPFVSLSDVNKNLYPIFLNEISKLLERGDFIAGEALTRFETQFAELCNAKYCVGVNSGLDALTFALIAADVKSGDEVIVPAHTFIATWMAVTRIGAVPVAVDADEVTANISVSQIEKAITKKTRAIVPVHLYGLPCEMERIMELASNYNLKVVEDNAQAQGATFKNRPTGGFGDINATSFYPSKNAGALGDGGAITTNDLGMAQRVLALRNYGSQQKYIHDTEGYNSRLDTIQAAFLRHKIAALAQMNEERRFAAAFYNKELKGISDLQLPIEPKDCTHIYHLYTVRTMQRDALKSFLMIHGVETGIHYPMPPHLQKVYSSLGYTKGDFPVAEKIASTTLSLPMYNGITPAQLSYVCEKVKLFFTKNEDSK